MSSISHHDPQFRELGLDFGRLDGRDNGSQA
jgi:hypothetical protein